MVIDPKVLAYYEQGRERFLEGLKALLRIPSISALPEHKGDVRRAADFLADELRAMGVENVRLVEGSGHPIILGERNDAPGKPTLALYGHYDVQPPDPLDEWKSPPFEPAVRGDNLYARGAVDDKGQVATFLEALRAWHDATGAPAGGVRFTVLLEGEEESGSVNLERFVAKHKALLADCAVCLISDTGMLGRDKPAITYGVRGLAYTEVILHAADQDLHSGMWGGRCPNPISELTKVLAQLWDANRHVTIPEFYEGVRELSPAERNAWANLGFNQIDAL
ncbi:MAG: M20/M25/M40 family metallo-hydrolase, partial [Acidobacteria bacterium]|nr:M20/M25/M40 family metallo-hydrolase [Acidobacteriota bacterium]